MSSEGGAGCSWQVGDNPHYPYIPPHWDFDTYQKWWYSKYYDDKAYCERSSDDDELFVSRSHVAGDERTKLVMKLSETTTVNVHFPVEEIYRKSAEIDQQSAMQGQMSRVKKRVKKRRKVKPEPLGDSDEEYRPQKKSRKRCRGVLLDGRPCRRSRRINGRPVKSGHRRGVRPESPPTLSHVEKEQERRAQIDKAQKDLRNCMGKVLVDVAELDVATLYEKTCAYMAALQTVTSDRVDDKFAKGRRNGRLFNTRGAVAFL